METQNWSYRFPASQCCELNWVASELESRSVRVGDLGSEGIAKYEETSLEEIAWGTHMEVVYDIVGDDYVLEETSGSASAYHFEDGGDAGRKKAQYRWKLVPLGSTTPWEARDGTGFTVYFRERTQHFSYNSGSGEYDESGADTFNAIAESVAMSAGETVVYSSERNLTASEGQIVTLTSPVLPRMFTVQADVMLNYGPSSGVWTGAGTVTYNLDGTSLTGALQHLLRGFYSERRGSQTRRLRLTFLDHEQDGTITWVQVSRPASGGESSSTGSVGITLPIEESIEVIIEPPGEDGRIFAQKFETDAETTGTFPVLVANQVCLGEE